MMHLLESLCILIPSMTLCGDRTKIVDFLLIANYWKCAVFFLRLYLCGAEYQEYHIATNKQIRFRTSSVSGFKIIGHRQQIYITVEAKKQWVAKGDSNIMCSEWWDDGCRHRGQWQGHNSALLPVIENINSVQTVYRWDYVINTTYHSNTAL